MTNTKNFRGFGGLIDELVNHGLSMNDFNKSAIKVKVPVNIQETEDAYIIYVNAPGRNRENFSISAEKNLLTISYKSEKNAEEMNDKWLRNEYHLSSFERNFSLNEKIDSQKINAKYIDGILQVTLGKAEPAQPTNIKITVE